MTKRHWLYLLLALFPVAFGIAVLLQSMGSPASQKFEQLLIDRQFEKARTEINRILKSDQGYAEAMFQLARLELAEDHPESAIDAIEEAARLNYNTRQIEILRGLVFARGGKYPEALKILVPAYLNHEKPEAEIAEGLARVYLAQFQATQARKAIESWKIASPNDDRPYLFLNEIEDRSGTDAATRIANYLAALNRNPGRFETHEKLASLYLDDNQLDNARNEFLKCLEIKPNHLPSRIGMAQVALKQGNQAEAETILNEVLSKDPNSIFALSELSQIELQKGSVETAVAHLKKAVEISPFTSELVYKYAQALKLAGNASLSKSMLDRSNQLKTEEARMDEIRKLLVSEPNNIAIRIEAAIWLINHGHEAEGLQWANLVLNKQPGEPQLCQFLATYFETKKDFGLANYYKSIIRK
ncbi:MAG: tetratricopeptide repeat protein [Planctomycetota bacterium]